MTGNDIRKQFLDYFQRYDHQVVRSSSLVPQDDPTLLFTNAGMVQFKRTFLGEEKRGYVRAATSQKCVRAGGKHNDLENVGYTARHHTFFEMLGNFSFGDYFKEKAIEFAWDLLTNGYGLPEDKLWVSIYLDDDEAFNLWRTIVGVPEDRIVRFGEKDNFWAMGDTGPCGPCSEIHIDRGSRFGCSPDCRLGCECDRYLEIWNLVFMQFNRDAGGTLTPLPKPSIDTGMGLERIVSILQSAPTNYDTDLILPIMRKAEALSEHPIGESAEADVAMKVIADHSRAMAFLIGDGVMPANEGRGYVLRRIMRRAIRYGRNLGLMRPFLHETARVVFDIMRPAYPELAEAEAFITNVIRNEEIRFSETLDKGLALLNDTLAEMSVKNQTQVPGDVIFKLYDTFGFPVDIVRDVVRDRNMTLDMTAFDRQMAEQREKSRSVVSFSQISDAYKKLSADGIIPKFVGYHTTTHDSAILLLVKEGKAVQSATAGDAIEMVVGETPFYGASGGQVGDIGRITAAGFEMTVTDTVKDPTGILIHKGTVEKGAVRIGDTVGLAVDEAARRATACNHTATHILHAALREILGDHVKQAGSLVAPDRLRFDFTHFSQVDADTLDRIEARVNEHIQENAPVEIVEMGAEEAFKTGAMALFEEKYGDRVRVISLDTFSKELCGGTHARLTGDIGCFKIISESSIASGVRRIEATSGRSAVQFIQKMAGTLRDAAGLLKDKPDAVVQRIEKTLSDNRAMEREIEQLKSKMATMSVAGIDDEVREINGVKVLAKRVAADNPGSLRDAADKFKDRLRSGIVVLGSAADNKAMLIAIVSKDLAGRFHAGKIIKETAAIVGGGGGGRPDMAQAGGTRPEMLDDALASVYEIIQRG
ncbi:alanine--tRNA ligase [Desulfococcus sp.]|uniref:alanine--tRNA ligase n=1 Tax=Desulfococcus sp. TaxID=2025834 RepID=UPI00359377EB